MKMAQHHHFVMLAAVFGIVFAFTTVFLVNHGTVTGQATNDDGTVQATVAEELGIIIVSGYDVIDFGAVSRDQRVDTLPPGSETPFLVRNEGNVLADVEVCTPLNLWIGDSRVVSDYQYSIAESDPRFGIPPCAPGTLCMDDCTGSRCFRLDNSKRNPTNILVNSNCPASGGLFSIDNLNWEDWRDEALMHLLLHVPADEPSRTAQFTVYVIGVAASTYPT